MPREMSAPRSATETFKCMVEILCLFFLVRLQVHAEVTEVEATKLQLFMVLNF